MTDQEHLYIIRQIEEEQIAEIHSLKECPPENIEKVMEEIQKRYLKRYIDATHEYFEEK